MLISRRRPRHRRIAGRARHRRRRRRRRRALRRRALVERAGAPRRARQRQPLGRRGDRPAAVRRPALGDRRLVRPVRRSAGDAGRALPGDGARSARGPVCRPRAAPSCCSAASFRRSTPTIGGEPDPAELRARALAAESAALAVRRRDQFQRRRRERLGDRPSRSPPRAASRAPIGATGHGCSAAVVAGEGAAMQRDHAWHSARHLDDLDAAAEIGRRAGERAVARLNPTRPKPGTYPVLFDPRVSSSLLGHFAGAISGSSVARKTSFLQDKLGSRVFATGVTIVDDPLRPRGLRSRPFDGEGVRVARHGAGRGRRAQQLDRRERVGAAARHRSRPAMRRAASAARPAQPEQPLHGGRRAQPRRAARRLSRGGAGDRADRPGRQRRDRRLQPRRRRLHGPRRRDRRAGRGDHHRLQPDRHVRDARAGLATSNSAAASTRRRCWCRK